MGVDGFVDLLREQVLTMESTLIVFGIFFVDCAFDICGVYTY